MYASSIKQQVVITMQSPQANINFGEGRQSFVLNKSLLIVDNRIRYDALLTRRCNLQNMFADTAFNNNCTLYKTASSNETLSSLFA